MPDTIAAIATGGGLSAVGIIRLSGDRAVEIVDHVFKSDAGIGMKNAENRKLYTGKLTGVDGGVIDMCMCTVSRAPRSYTGEDTAELHCHGSPVVLAEGLRALFAAGARQARAGEFTERAFLNGKMDLTQAEAVIDLIEAETADAARNAAGQLGRALGRRTDALYEELIAIMSHFHAVLDYPDEDIEDFQLLRYRETLDRAEKTLADLLSTYGRGRILKEGLRCAVIGRPNTGKSSLMNALLGYDRAIVTDIAGTTRDTIEEKIRLGGLLLRLCDTAGIHETGDAIEREGVHRALEAASDAQLVLAVFDGGEELREEDLRVLETAAQAPRAIAVVNKADREMRIDTFRIEESVSEVCIVSALEHSGLDGLAERIGAMFPPEKEVPVGEILTSERQADAVRRALDAVREAGRAMEAGITPDAVLTWVEAAAVDLGELTGKILREDVTAGIFHRFCVGK